MAGVPSGRERRHRVGKLRRAHEECELRVDEVRARGVSAAGAAVDDCQRGLHLVASLRLGLLGIGRGRQLRELLAQGRERRIAAAVDRLLHLLHGGDDAGDGGPDLRVGDACLRRRSGQRVIHLVHGEARGRDGLGSLHESERVGRGGEDVCDRGRPDRLHVAQAEPKHPRQCRHAVDQAEVVERAVVVGEPKQGGGVGRRKLQAAWIAGAWVARSTVPVRFAGWRAGSGVKVGLRNSAL